MNIFSMFDIHYFSYFRQAAQHCIAVAAAFLIMVVIKITTLFAERFFVYSLTQKLSYFALLPGISRASISVMCIHPFFEYP